MEVEVNRVSSTLFEIILKPHKQMVSLRLDYEILLAYEKLTAVLNTKYDTKNKITRTRLMTLILEEAIRRPELIEELVSQKFGNGGQ